MTERIPKLDSTTVKTVVQKYWSVVVTVVIGEVEDTESLILNESNPVH